MRIALFTDVSYSADTRLGAYAIWAKVKDGDVYQGAAMFKTSIANINIAESCALINGVILSIESINPPEGAKIIAHTDSVGAITILTTTGRQEGLAEVIQDRLAKHRMTIEFRHVKAHYAGIHRSLRHVVNAWCDREAKRVFRNSLANY